MTTIVVVGATRHPARPRPSGQGGAVRRLPSMSSKPTRADATTATTGPPGQPAEASPGPPVARRIPSERTHHGDTVIDDYAWLADKDNPETLRYLEAENAYTAAMTAGQAGLREE